ncbi:hypothetical protein MAFF301069_10680 [Ralstonia pseudosolanacearum]|nr:hypothetical protein MAFF301069_10680 [Ralstonia pseudosolanacearum]
MKSARKLAKIVQREEPREYFVDGLQWPAKFRSQRRKSKPGQSQQLHPAGRDIQCMKGKQVISLAGTFLHACLAPIRKVLRRPFPHVSLMHVLDANEFDDLCLLPSWGS